MALSDYYPELAGWKPAEIIEPLSEIRPAIPDPNMYVSPFLRTTQPLVLQYQQDTIKQYNRPGLSSYRVAPLAPNAKSEVVASAASVTKIINQTSGGSGVTLETNGSLNATQSILNIIAGANIQATSDGSGGVTIVGTAGGDSLTHGDPVWEYDPAYVILRDDFTVANPSGSMTSTAATPSGQFGELGWAWFGSAPSSGGAIRIHGGNPPYVGQLSGENSTTSNSAVAWLLNTTTPGTLAHTPNAFALLENPGWKATFIFKIDSNTKNSTPPIPFRLNKKSIYVGLTGANIGALAVTATTNSRPDVFVGLRFDTRTNPQGFALTSVANASAGTTVYTGTITNGGAAAYVGLTVTIKGFSTAANNGTFTVTAITATTITVNNASGVAETPAVGLAFVYFNAVPVTAAAAASGGNTVYTTTATGYAGSQLIGCQFIVSGFTNGANNGTFTCVDNTTASITLNNPNGVLETKNTQMVGGNINDSFFVFEAVQNRQFTPQVHNAQGQTFVTTEVPTPGKWYRLDMVCTVAGQIKLTLNGSATNTVTFTIPTQSYTPLSNSPVGSSGISAQIQPVVSAAIGSTASYFPFAAGSVVTFTGFTGGNAGLNGTYTLELQQDSGGSAYLEFPNSSVIGANNVINWTAEGYPALTPLFQFGNDDTNGAIQAFKWFIDYFSLVWNPNLGPNAPGTPDVTKARYW